MFDIGFSEMFLVFVIALIVVGPERLPGLARKVGGYLQKARKTFQKVSQEVQMELDSEELNRKLTENNILPDTKEIKKELSDIKEQIDSSSYEDSPPES